MQHLKYTPISIDEHSVTCSFSYGIANFPSDDTTYAQLIKIGLIPLF